jgi:hypothetical protein
MCRSSLYGRVGKSNHKQADNEEDRQLSAKLHCLFGIPSTNVGRRVLATHSWARSRVYDLRNYTDETRWGPFRDDGSMRVDWEMIESLMIVLGYNSGLCCRRFLHRFRPPWTEPLEGLLPDRANIMPGYPPKLYMQPDIPLQLKDPYNVSGVWSRVSHLNTVALQIPYNPSDRLFPRLQRSLQLQLQHRGHESPPGSAQRTRQHRRSHPPHSHGPENHRSHCPRSIRQPRAARRQVHRNVPLRRRILGSQR